MDAATEVNKLCLEVFASVSAMVTHDLKNTLAIMNENAGLLDDLALMTEDGAVPGDRVRTAAAKIAQQVSRSNAIIKNLNRFAHSGDTPVTRVAAGEPVQLMAELTTRKAAMRTITVQVECDADHQLELALFHFEALCCRILLYLYGVAEVGSRLTVRSRRDGERLVLHFAVPVTSEAGAAQFPGPAEGVLLASLGGSCQTGADGVILTLPAP